MTNLKTRPFNADTARAVTRLSGFFWARGMIGTKADKPIDAQHGTILLPVLSDGATGWLLFGQLVKAVSGSGAWIEVVNDADGFLIRVPAMNGAFQAETIGEAAADAWIAIVARRPDMTEAGR